MNRQMTNALAQGDQTPVVLKGVSQEMFFEGMQVEIIEINGEPYFEVYSTGMALGHFVTAKGKKYPNKDRVDKNIESAGITVVLHDAKPYINEEQLYDLMLEMKTDKVKPFRKWVTSKVLPAIRKYGAYMTDDTIEKALTEPDFLIRLATKLKEEKELRIKAEAQIEADKPKVLFADAVSVSSTTILIGDLAKLLKQNGIETGQKRLFEWLRENGYLIKRKGADYNSPTQYAMELGLFEVKETVVTHADGHTTVNKTTKVTGKGQQYFINKFLQKKGAAQWINKF